MTDHLLLNHLDPLRSTNRYLWISCALGEALVAFALGLAVGARAKRRGASRRLGDVLVVAEENVSGLGSALAMGLPGTMTSDSFGWDMLDHDGSQILWWGYLWRWDHCCMGPKAEVWHTVMYHAGVHKCIFEYKQKHTHASCCVACIFTNYLVTIDLPLIHIHYESTDHLLLECLVVAENQLISSHIH